MRINYSKIAKRILSKYYKVKQRQTRKQTHKTPNEHTQKKADSNNNNNSPH